MHRQAALGFRVHVVAPFGRDAENMAALLDREGYAPQVHPDLGAAALRIGDETGVVVVTDEALGSGLPALAEALAAQPPWSDIPFVLLAAPSRGRTRGVPDPRHGLPDAIVNAVVMERPLGSASLLTAITAAMRARQKQFDMRDRLADLAESEGRLRLATGAADIGTWDLAPGTGALRWDARCKALFGLPADAVVTLDTFYAGVHADDRDAAAEAVNGALDPAGDGAYDIEYRTVGLSDGVERWIAAKGGAIFQGGAAVRFIGTVIDITERKQADLALAASQQALRRESRELDHLARTLEQKVVARTAELEAEMASRSRAEAALRQSQKMEAVGQLTGGIAHDFNNMLTGVIGAMDIMKRRLAAGRTDDLQRFMDAAATSAQRAAALTARLLAFSRRQSLDAKPVDVNALTIGLEELLTRSITENIRLSIVAPDGLPPAIADANQLENAILNLVINARDAMPDGGQLTIETSMVTLDEAYAAARPDVTPGRYVMIAVSDTGVGMTADVLDKVFEPFFSTKPIGQGTGLGLSMVYGFARQSGGQVRIHSEAGVGTSVKLYLPLAPGGIDADEATESPSAPKGRGQIVLLVEDDASVRLLVREVLEELGYAALEAGDADTALPIVRSGARIDLMISDVGLPGLNGRQLAELVRAERPELPILFVTGYAENAAIRAGFLGTGMSMITKPFAIEALSAKVAEMMPEG